MISSFYISISSSNVHFELWHLYAYYEDDTDGYHTFTYRNEYLFLRETNGILKNASDISDLYSLAEQGYSLYETSSSILQSLFQGNPGLQGINFNISLLSSTYINDKNQWVDSGQDDLEMWSKTQLSGKTVRFTSSNGKEQSFAIDTLNYTLINNNFLPGYYIEVYNSR